MFVPGLATTSRLFSIVAANLARDHRVVTVDLPGHGEYRQDAELASLAAAADAVRAVIDTLSLRNAVLVGWELGSDVAYTFLQLFGTDQVSAVISMEESAHIAGGSARANGRQEDFTPGTGDAQATRSEAVEITRKLIRTLRTARNLDSKMLAELESDALACDPRALQSLLAEARVRGRQDWSTIKVPTLFVRGANTSALPFGSEAQIIDPARGTELIVIPNSGNLPFLDEPSLFCDKLRSFMTQYAPRMAPQGLSRSCVRVRSRRQIPSGASYGSRATSPYRTHIW
ncbi:alpha/beta fold hydrolase [Catenulispora sp. EB89]|uniref:alpha/beta fold hydrolase n=1 Tax=Catenulispora sp. EB89 TaxID=3156257 RepID=UPI0035131878